MAEFGYSGTTRSNRGIPCPLVWGRVSGILLSKGRFGSWRFAQGTFVPFMRSAWLSCNGTSNWLGAFEGRGLVWCDDRANILQHPQQRSRPSKDLLNIFFNSSRYNKPPQSDTLLILTTHMYNFSNHEFVRLVLSKSIQLISNYNYFVWCKIIHATRASSSN